MGPKLNILSNSQDEAGGFHISTGSDLCLVFVL